MVRNPSFEVGHHLSAWKRVCETLFIALQIAALYDLMFRAATSSPIPLKMFVAAMFASVIHSTVQVSLSNLQIRADDKVRIDYLRLSNLQTMDESLYTSRTFLLR
jgi:hypothetical protein